MKQQPTGNRLHQWLPFLVSSCNMYQFMKLTWVYLTYGRWKKREEKCCELETCKREGTCGSPRVMRRKRGTTKMEEVKEDDEDRKGVIERRQKIKRNTNLTKNSSGSKDEFQVSQWIFRPVNNVGIFLPVVRILWMPKSTPSWRHVGTGGKE